MEKVSNYEDLLLIIRTSMAVQGVTQKELAERLNRTQPQVNRLLRGKNSPSIDLVFRILEELNINVGVQTPV
jgi:transcriptional regulator with XRE-family HTH domain